MQSIDPAAWFLHVERMNGLFALGCLVMAAAMGGFWLRRQLFNSNFAVRANAARRSNAAMLLRLAALLLIAIAVLDPRVGQERGEFGRSSEQIVLLLDRSRSMLADDAQPSRFALAVHIAKEVVDRSFGAAVAIVSFAADARIDSPLSRDLGESNRRLRSLKPETNAQGGTSLADGLSLAGGCFAKPFAGRKRLIVLTDGETHGEVSLAGVDIPRDAEVILLGIGDSKTGSRIPLEPQAGNVEQPKYLVHDGQIVWTKSQPEKLGELAERLHGSQAQVSSPSAAIGILFGGRQGRDDSIQWQGLATATPVYAPLCYGALTILVAEWLLLANFHVRATDKTPSRSGKIGVSRPIFCSRRSIFRVLSAALGWPTVLSRKRRAVIALLGALFICCFAGGANPRALTSREAARIYNQGVEAFRRGAWSEAEKRFRETMSGGEGPLSRFARFNLANTQYERTRRGGMSKQQARSRLGEAIELYRQCLFEGQRPDDARANLQIAYSLLKRIEDHEPTREPPGEDRDGGTSSNPPPDQQTTRERERGQPDETDGDKPGQGDPSGPRVPGGGSAAVPQSPDDRSDAEVDDELRRIDDAARRRTPAKQKQENNPTTTVVRLPW